MNVVFISPHYPPEMAGFTRGLAEVGANVIGVGEGSAAALPNATRGHLADWVSVPKLFDEESAANALVRALRGRKIDRIESLWEPTVLLAARVRDLTGVPGMSRDTVLGFRDKQLMKERVARAGLRVPLSRRVTTVTEARHAALEIGFPVIIKPIAGAGSADTFRCDDGPELERALARMSHIGEASVEEFIDGEEFTCDAISIDGRPVFESVTQYHPRPLIARSEEWVSPAQLTFRDPHERALAGGVELGRNVLAALGMGSGFTHMEWYKKSNGEVVFGEIAARSGGGHLIDMMNWANDIDVYREWARAVCWGRFDARVARRYHVAMVFKRALGQGRIARIEGLRELRAACGPAWVGDHLLPVGTRRRNWKQTVVSDGGVALRHPDYRTCRALMEKAIGELTLYARP